MSMPGSVLGSRRESPGNEKGFRAATERRTEVLKYPPTGPRAVIVGNGSSVDAMPPAFWRTCDKPALLLVGTNRVLCFAALRELSWDALVIRDTYRNLWRDQEVGARYHEELWKPCSCWKVGPADRRVTHCDEFVRQVPGWQFEPAEDENHETAVMRNSSVVLMAANWAWLQGAREIFLVGVDYCGRHGRMTDPYGTQSPGWEGQYDKAVSPGIRRQFAAAVDAVASHGGRMLNLSPTTRLTAVPECRWTELCRPAGTRGYYANRPDCDQS